VANLKVNEAETARVALEEKWRQLASEVERAKQFKAATADNPRLADDPLVQAYVRWLDTFEQDMAAIQTVHDATTPVPLADLRAAQRAADELLWAIQQAKERVPPSSAAEQRLSS